MEKTFFLPTRDLAVFPGVVTPLYVGRLKSINSLEAAVADNNKIVLAMQKDAMVQEPNIPEDIYTTGVIVNILQIVKLQDNNLKVLVEAQDRVKLENITVEDERYVADYEIIEAVNNNNPEAEAIYRTAYGIFEEYINKIGNMVSTEVLMNIDNMEDVSKSIDIMISTLDMSTKEKQNLIETFDVKARGMKLIEYLVSENEVANLENKIERQVKKKMSDAQKDYYLREKLEVVKKELGEGKDDDLHEVRQKMKKAKLPKKVYEQVEKELKKLSKMPPYSAEATVVRNYIDTIIDLPWSKETPDSVDLKEANTILERDHYGLKDAKEKVLDYLAVKKLNPNMKGSILCFVGPPGIGKTSLVKSIADSMGRKFVRVSLGGVKDESEIRGHRRTYIGSMPGKILKALKDAGTKNPVILLDEIDKMSSDVKGDPASAMLEVLDPEQNSHFEDHYLDMPFDLSKVFFVATANDLRPVASPLRDRMDIVPLSSYTEYEKLHIAKRYLVKQAIEENGLTKIDVNISDNTILKVINDYTREAGVRNLKRQIITICRKIAKDVVEKEITKVSIRANNLEKYLGKPKFRPEKQCEKVGKVGIVNGLAWTAVGGVTLEVQGVAIPSKKAELTLTGTLGKVMTESANVAFTYVRANSDKFKPKSEDFLEKNNIHLHFPEGATPKDGPSAGITIATTIISVLMDRKVRQDIAMTGEITITGEVLAIGGVREKVIGAHRSGIREVILPIDNKKDIDEIPVEVAREMKINFASTYDDVEKLVFEK